MADSATRSGRVVPLALAPGEKLHIHVNNTSDLGDVFETTPERWQAALARHPDVADRIEASVSRDHDGLEDGLAAAHILFCWDIPRERLAERAPKLRLIHAHAAGVSHLMPLDWLPDGVVLANSRGVHGERAAEYAIMAVLMLNNRVPQMVTNQRENRWLQLFNTAITGKTLLIVGVGSVGGSVARLAKTFGLTVVGVRRSGEPHPDVDVMHTPDAVPDLVAEADFILVTAPQTDASRHIIGAAEIARMKPGAGIVNYSRAGLVDYDALRTRLEQGDIAAVLDVFNPEPLPADSPLWSTPNLIVTPHCSSDDPDVYTPRTLDLVFGNARRLLAGEPLHNLVDPSLQY